MPPRKNSAEPPPVMTWAGATPVIAVGGVFDAVRLFFEWFVFSGPALAAVYCTAKINGVLTTWTAGVLGTKTAALACSAAVVGVASGVTVVTGGISAEVVETFGIVMSMAVGFVGFLIIVGLLFATDARIFKVNRSSFLLLTGSLVLAEIPFIGSLPSFLVVLWVLYRRQMKVEKAALEKWEKGNADAQLQARNQQLAQIQMMQMQDAQAQEEQLEEQEEATNDAQDEEERQEADGKSQTEREEAATAYDIQFETLHDALSELNDKQNRTEDENSKLRRAEQIMLSVSIDANERDPVLRAAYERARQGQKVSDGTEETRGGFVFNNLQMVRASKAQFKSEVAANDDTYREKIESPVERDKAV